MENYHETIGNNLHVSSRFRMKCILKNVPSHLLQKGANIQKRKCAWNVDCIVVSITEQAEITTCCNYALLCWYHCFI